VEHPTEGSGVGQRSAAILCLLDKRGIAIHCRRYRSHFPMLTDLLCWKAARLRESQNSLSAHAAAVMPNPCVSGIQARVLNPCPTAIGLFPYRRRLMFNGAVFKSDSSLRDQAVWSPANTGRQLASVQCIASLASAFEVAGTQLLAFGHQDSDSSTNS